MGLTISETEWLQDIIQTYKADRHELVAILKAIQERWRFVCDDAMAFVADEMELPFIHVKGTATFYRFLTQNHAGKYTVHVNTSATAEIAGVSEVLKAFEDEVGVKFGQTSSDLQIGLFKTACIGMSDQEPAVLINDKVFTRLTPARVRDLVKAMRLGTPPGSLPGACDVQNMIRLKGPVFFEGYVPGRALARAMQLGSLEVLEEVKRSRLRGRGGAGFPTGQKWASCRAAPAEVRYVICNIDEGEPGTFKDRVLVTKRAEMIFEGMIIAGYGIESKIGIVYLRGEYSYLREHIEQTLDSMRARHLLGHKIAGTHFSFDIHIKEGAGAYICGEESALIESAEGKRGEPRNRPPYPVTSGFERRPTIVNNPETFGCVVKIIEHGAKWFSTMGTEGSSGVKLLSVAGDCERPGIYEIEWGTSVQEILKLCGAKNVLAVQVGGPSGECLSEREFHRKLSYEDLPTGGAFTVFNKERDLLKIVRNHIEFFKEESCGFCVPCRAGNSLLLKALDKVIAGNGTSLDLQDIKGLAHIVRSASRCGLGQTSPNPILTTMRNFPEMYSGHVRTNVDYLSQFNLDFAVQDYKESASKS